MDKKLVLFSTLMFLPWSLAHTAQQQDFARIHEDKLSNLSEELLLAGVDRASVFYSTPYQDFNLLHEKGNVIDESFLANVFFGSMFQFYTNELLGYNIKSVESYNAWLFNASVAQDMSVKITLGMLANKLSKHPIPMAEKRNFLVQRMPIVAKAIKNFKQNKLLMRLGIAFERQKIIVEKLQGMVTAELASLLYRHDRYAIDLQSMIYYFMKEGYEKFIENMKITPQEQMNEASDFLTTFVPSFAQYPYYRELIEKLAELGSPMKI